jgi:putative spermidine/putrescine transport system ATP-binding protein
MPNLPVSTSTQGAVSPQPQVSDSLQQAIAANTAGVTLRSVTKKYGSFTAVENINLDIPAGSYYYIRQLHQHLHLGCLAQNLPQYV